MLTNRQNGGAEVRNKTGATLRGLVACGRCGSAMVHTFTTRKNRRYRFYVCSKAHNEGTTACPKARVAAGPFEAFVANQIKVMGTDEELVAKTADATARLANDTIDPERLRVALAGFQPIWEQLSRVNRNASCAC